MNEGSATFEVDDRTYAVGEVAEGRGLCNECFGRLFGRRGHGLSNPERAARVRGEDGPAVPASDAPCPICDGAFARLDVWRDRVVQAGQGWEWATFTCGSRWEPELLAREEKLWSDVGATEAESLRTAFNRELGKKVEAATSARGGASGDVVFLADVPVGRVEVTVLPVYFEGRYRKLDRTIPQTRWPCRKCQGRGCDHCQGTGRTYPTSVEELVAAPVLAATGGKGTRFHGMGREDIDARMLGRGRPFVLEILEPRHRTIDLAPLAESIRTGSGGRVEVTEFRGSTAARVIEVKELSPEKSYRVTVAGEVAPAKINEALTLATAKVIAQRTPGRVAHRRSDRVRTRRVVAALLVESESGRFTLEIRTEAGTYVKEWVEGDGGRTEPSLAGLLQMPLKVEALDVLEVHDTH